MMHKVGDIVRLSSGNEYLLIKKAFLEDYFIVWRWKIVNESAATTNNSELAVKYAPIVRTIHIPLAKILYG